MPAIHGEHNAMNIAFPHSAFFLPPRTSGNSGVDFLGLRQANLDMMAELIPSTNNVTWYVRPFALLCWIYWKFHALCVEANIQEPTSAHLKAFRERIEVLFTWGAQLEDYPGIPGRQSPAPVVADNLVPLTFADWHRVQSSTSLVAALWYGPASKTITGLALIEPIPRKSGFFRTVGNGVALAGGLDLLLRADGSRYSQLLATLKPVSASAEDARALWSLWSPVTISRAEQGAFRGALFDDTAVGDYRSLIGKRSSTLALARLHLAHCLAPADPQAIRRGMFLSQTDRGHVYDVPEALEPARRKWIILQMRQLQRFALECLLSWCEKQIIAGRQDAADLVEDFERVWKSSNLPFTEAKSLADILDVLDPRVTSLDTLIASFRSGDLPSPFSLIEQIQTELSTSGAKLAPLCLYGLVLCAAFPRCFPDGNRDMRLGEAQRISFYHLRKRIVALGTMPFGEGVRFVIEAMILSQHFATAVNRFDGQNQRLRLAIEETGLCALVREPLYPAVTEDRLSILLALAGESGLLKKTTDGGYQTAAA
jgi:hypothetical protein